VAKENKKADLKNDEKIEVKKEEPAVILK